MDKKNILYFIEVLSDLSNSKKIPKLIFFPAQKIINFLKRKFFDSRSYWEERYSKGQDSGIGSKGYLATYKAEIINSFVRKNSIQTVLEFGCGDGMQLEQYSIPNYIGTDVSATAIALCKAKFSQDFSKTFILRDERKINPLLPKVDLTLSIDVLFHLIEYKIFKEYIKALFSHSNKYVIIYSTNFPQTYQSPHQVDREIVKFIASEIHDFVLEEIIENPYKGEDTMSDFFIYKKAG